MPRSSYLPRRRRVRPGVLPALCLALLLAAGCRARRGSGGGAESRSSSAPADSSIRTGVEQDSAGTPASGPQAAKEITVLAFGNSLTAGYGLADGANAYPALLQQKADSAGLANVRVVNAGNSGETTAGGRRRIDYVLQHHDVDVLLLELGGNDALRGLPPDSARANLRAIIRKTKARFPDARVVLAGMKAPPNMGTAYTQRFEKIYPALAEETGAHLVPFLLEGVAGRSALNQPDGIHPTAAGHHVLAKNVWRTLGPLLHEMRGKQGAPSASARSASAHTAPVGAS